MDNGRWRDEIDTLISPENDEESLMNSLEGNDRYEYEALRSRVSQIGSHRGDPLMRDLENYSLSDDEQAIMERYEELRNMARERLNGDVIM